MAEVRRAALEVDCAAAMAEVITEQAVVEYLPMGMVLALTVGKLARRMEWRLR